MGNCWLMPGWDEPLAPAWGQWEQFPLELASLVPIPIPTLAICRGPERVLCCLHTPGVVAGLGDTGESPPGSTAAPGEGGGPGANGLLTSARTPRPPAGAGQSD